MHTVPLTADLGHLLQGQAAALRTGLNLNGLSGWWMRLPWASRWVLPLLRLRLLEKMLHILEKYLTADLVLKGILADVHTYTHPEQWADEPWVDDIIDQLQGMETDLLAKREVLLHNLRQLDTVPPAHAGELGSLRPRMARVAQANADMFETAQTLRWELMECQADADKALGRVHRFASTEEAVAFLRAA